MGYITYHRCIVMSYDTSPIIDAWSCHVIHHLPGHSLWYITFHRCIVMLCCSSPSIDAMSSLLIHHLPSMHGHVLWYIIYHRWFLTYQWYIKHHLPSCNVINQLYRYMIMLYDTSPTIDVICTFHSIDAWWYITYHRCIVMSYHTSPTIDTWSYHMIHHLPSMHYYVIWSMVMSSPSIDAWSC